MAIGRNQSKSIRKERTMTIRKCPFCGGEPIGKTREGPTGDTLYFIRCRTCRGQSGLFKDPESCIYAWNRRNDETNEVEWRNDEEE